MRQGKKDNGVASGGGVGTELVGFIFKADLTNNFSIELWGLREMLKLAKERGLKIFVGSW